MRLTQRILGACTVVQGALESILNDTPPGFYSSTVSCLQVSLQTDSMNINPDFIAAE